MLARVVLDQIHWSPCDAGRKAKGANDYLVHHFAWRPQGPRENITGTWEASKPLGRCQELYKRES